MLVNVTLENVNEGCVYYCEIENWDICETVSDVFREAKKQYGKCMSKIYVDTENSIQVSGWVFEKKVKYADCNDKYIQRAWIEPLIKVIEKTEYHYASGYVSVATRVKE